MADDEPARVYRFGIFEADASTGELRRQGVRVKLNAQPFQVLCLLLRQPGELLTREEICRQLWPEGTFVDYEHGVNSAVNRIREALGDTAASPRYIETLARRGYRFVAPVARVPAPNSEPIASAEPAPPADPATDSAAPPESGAKTRRGILASAEQLPKVSHATAQTLFVLFQVMYLGFYVGALANLTEIQELISVLAYPTAAFAVIIATAAILIPTRAYVLTAVLLRAPGMRGRILTLWPFLLVLDELWAPSPFLLLHHIDFGVAVACTALLVCAPFAQRSLVLMGAGGTPPGRAEIT
ncbi:MAG TPA: winged helix-turn-helix domain-containing protein [Acidobacteriaceae bacterium]|jgi:cholera toxin transcriptional activator|nr:winged helix-turn-helix domain-containing protein [Acidobacteriaceae bacterium]